MKTKSIRVNLLLAHNKSELETSISDLVRNGTIKGFTFFNEKTQEAHLSPIEEIVQNIVSEAGATLSAKVENFTFNISIKWTQENGILFCYPLEPYKLKKDIGCNQEMLDFCFYIGHVVELCKAFAIHEFIAE